VLGFTPTLGQVRVATERIEYDPNRSSWIVLVRWIEGVLCFRKRFALSKVNSQRKENAWPFLGRKEFFFFFSASYFRFLPCLIKLREKALHLIRSPIC